MICTFEYIQMVVKTNPNKANITQGQELAKKLRLHLNGVGMDKAIKQCEYFASPEVYAVQKQYATSNVDLFSRLLQQEEMIFSARGGSSYFNLPELDERSMNAMLDNLRYGMNLRKWIKTFALQAYRSDPMGLIFMEQDVASVDGNGVLTMPQAYPTYKSIFGIYDYLNVGRKLEYVCFQLTAGEAIAFGITDDSLKVDDKSKLSLFYRFVDDAKDVIVMFKEANVSLVTNITQKNPLKNFWGRTPGFIVSDLIQYDNPSCFLSPVSSLVELADSFLQDRSVRDLQKKYHGFAKAIEPLMTCGVCFGAKYINGQNCSGCTPPGGEPTGFKLKTKVSDVARFPMELFEKGGSFDFNKIFGYVSPDVKGWEKQDSALDDLEELMEMTYWGTIRMKRPQAGKGTVEEPRTATEVDSNDAPKESRLNITADWAEKTEQMICDFLGAYWFAGSFKRSQVTYGRDYILKTADQLMENYQTMRTKGAPDFSLDEALEKYYRAAYQNNPLQLQKYLKKLDVEPFPHLSILNAKSVITDFNDYNTKLYYGEWADTIPDIDWIKLTAVQLKTLLREYVTEKKIPEPKPVPNPALN